MANAGQTDSGCNLFATGATAGTHAVYNPKAGTTAAGTWAGLWPVTMDSNVNLNLKMLQRAAGTAVSQVATQPTLSALIDEATLVLTKLNGETGDESVSAKLVEAEKTLRVEVTVQAAGNSGRKSAAAWLALAAQFDEQDKKHTAVDGKDAGDRESERRENTDTPDRPAETSRGITQSRGAQGTRNSADNKLTQELHTPTGTR
ncbi:hypothetical protein TRVL_08524 [Trypanosoma vivax]|nr:hypothetical protein TRVL_08524 [Trypanosoma vivax]